MTMESQIIQELAKCLQNNVPVALVSIIASSGSSPGKTGAIMTVRHDGQICGTVGGGNLEHTVIQEAITSLAKGESREIRHILNQSSSLGMQCGGELRLFIKAFQPMPHLIIVGAGHIGQELYSLGLHQGFRISVIDDRPEMVSQERYPNAERLHNNNLAEPLTLLPIHQNSYITIASRSHDTDKLALQAIAESAAAYIGMVGSRNKIQNIMQNLLQHGIGRDKLERVYAPMGINIASVQPKEIAMSIMSEILLVKNRGTLEHMRSIKNIQF